MSTSTQIRVDAPAVTMINIFTVEPERQDLLVHLLEQATEDVMRHHPGFVSANIHRGLDGSTVANYAQWASRGTSRRCSPTRWRGSTCTRSPRWPSRGRCCTRWPRYSLSGRPDHRPD